MIGAIRLKRSLFLDIHADIGRLHSHAFERVGFVFAKAAQDSAGALLIAYDYNPVDDEDYIEDPGVGARINSNAIRKAMQRAFTTGDCVMHVHAHDFSATPAFSAVDLRSLSDLMPSFYNAAPNSAHGALVLGKNCAAGCLWAPRRKEAVSAKVSVVGHPLVITGGSRARSF